MVTWHPRPPFELVLRELRLDGVALERMIKEIDKDENVNLVKSSKQGEAHETAGHRMESDDTEVVDFSTASPQKYDDEITLAKTLMNIKKSVGKDKGKTIIFYEEEQAQLLMDKEYAQQVQAQWTKYPIIDWEIYIEGTRQYWKIIRVGNITEVHQFFDDMIKAFNREDLVKLWSLVKERNMYLIAFYFKENMSFELERCRNGRVHVKNALRRFSSVEASVDSFKLFGRRKLLKGTYKAQEILLRGFSIEWHVTRRGNSMILTLYADPERQDGNETLYHAWERYNNLMFKCLTHDLNDYQKKWHDEESNRDLGGSSSDGMSVITNKLIDLGHDIRKLKGSESNETPRSMPVLVLLLKRLMLATAHARIDVSSKKILLEDVIEFIKKGLTEILLGRPFKDSSGLEESVMEGLVWFKIRDGKTIFQMPRVISRFHHLSAKQCNMMAPILRISDKDKANGFDHAYKKIKEFYKGCLQLSDEYKRDEKVTEWITHGHASVHDMMILQQREIRMTSPRIIVKRKLGCCHEATTRDVIFHEIVFPFKQGSLVNASSPTTQWPNEMGTQDDDLIPCSVPNTMPKSVIPNTHEHDSGPSEIILLSIKVIFLLFHCQIKLLLLEDIPANDFEDYPADYVAFLVNVLAIKEPLFYLQAVTNSMWVDAMIKELQSLETNDTWTLTELPSDHKAISSKCVYKVKFLPNGTVDKYKARLVIRGFSQKEGLDYKHTFSPSNLKIAGFSNADWTSCIMTKKSLTGYCIFLGHSLVSWKTKNQATISRSYTEAEYRSMAATTYELMWLTYLLKDLHIQVQVPITLFCDNKAAQQIAANPCYHERTKHLDIDSHFTRDKVQEGFLQTAYIPIS
uniref:Retrovirus-related Pol polyprotein from transposon TNT 1-94 n=1 Tax=Tanacetum cinerariifolium TaxID=118510 RepID=A0A6L2KPU1_TANCI|nr:retrovirus-related Pol polyprotein from transposon TNT 1-94 [Tanacetum cinerariifolium]